MRAVIRDLRRATRQFTKGPGFVLPVVLTLAIGLGSFAAVLAVVYAVIVRPLPYPDSDRLITLRHSAPGWGVANAGISEAVYKHYRAYSHSFEEIGVYIENTVSLTDLERAERVPVVLVTPSVQTILGIAPILGRSFTEADVAPGTPTVVMLTHELWMNRYRGDPAIVGRFIEANSRRLEVVGILPPGLTFPRREIGLWYASSLAGKVPRVRDLYLSGIARLKPGISTRMAAAELSSLIPSMAGVYQDAAPETFAAARLTPAITTLKEEVIANIKLPLTVLLYAISLVLLISWANVSNLFLVRGETRRREIALQRALGATTPTLLRAFVCDSTVLAVPAAIIGLIGAQVGLVSILERTLEPIPRVGEITIDTFVIAATLGLTLLTILALTLLSFVQSGRLSLTGALRSGGRQATASRRQRVAQHTLVCFQVALAVVVLIASSIMLQTLSRLRSVDLGVAADNRLTFSLALRGDRYPTYHQQAAFYQRLLQELRAQPGLEGAAAAATVPLVPIPSKVQSIVDVRPVFEATSTAAVRANFNAVSPDYFELMSIPIKEGRAFDRTTRLDSEIPVVVSEALARSLGAGGTIVGQRIYTPESADFAPYVVVGVAGNVRGASIADGPTATVYVPVVGSVSPGLKPQFHAPAMTVIVRTPLDMTASVPLVRRASRTVGPDLAVGDIRMFDTIVDASLARTHLIATLLTVAAAASMALALVGIFGLTAHLVSQRSKEMAVRLAIGARPWDIKRVFLAQTATMACVGIVAGVLGSIAVTSSMRSLLFGIGPRDPATLLGASLLVFAIVLGSAYVPARRAARLDPMRSLANDA